MIKHIVMFKFKDQADGKSKAENIVAVKLMLEDLPDDIDVIREFEVGITIIDENPTHDMVLVSSFDTMADLILYREHPEHQLVVDYLKEVVSERAVVDYLF